MRQSWYESAKRNLSPNERLMFFECCFEFEFYNHEPDRANITSNSVLAMFDMIREQIESDAEKARNRAQAARRNGLKGGRPKVSKNTDFDKNPDETKENQKKPNGLSLVNVGLAYTYNNNNNNNTFSFFHKDTEKYTNFLILLYFFENGFYRCNAEREKFLNYYTARDWKDAQNRKITNKLALAYNWKPEQTPSVELYKKREIFAKLLHHIDAEDDILINSFGEIIIDRDKETIYIRFICVDNEPMQLLEHKYIKGVQDYFKNYENYRLMYQIIKP